MAAPPKTEKALATMTPAMRDRLDTYADAHELSRAEAIRRLVDQGLVAWEHPEPGRSTGQHLHFGTPVEE